MKRKIFTLLLCVLCLCWLTKAQVIELEPQWDGTYGKNCLIPVDLYVDTEWEWIFNVWVYIQSDLEFVDFVLDTWWIFSHMTPIEIDGDIVSFAAFEALWKDVFVWESKIWVMYYKWWDNKSDHLIEVLFDTGSDMTSSIINWGWINIMRRLSSRFVKISDDVESCGIKSVDEIDIEWWVAHLSYDEAMDKLISWIEEDWKQLKRQAMIKKVKKYSVIGGIIAIVVIISVVVLLWCKNKSQWKNY